MVKPKIEMCKKCFSIYYKGNSCKFCNPEPECYGSDPGYQAQAENDCHRCKFEIECFKTSDRNETLRKTVEALTSLNSIELPKLVYGLDIGDGDKAIMTVGERSEDGSIRVINSFEIFNKVDDET